MLMVTVEDKPGLTFIVAVTGLHHAGHKGGVVMALLKLTRRWVGNTVDRVSVSDRDERLTPALQSQVGT